MTHEQWRRVVGSKIAARTRVGRLSRGTLTIKVASSAWSNELSFLREDLTGRLVQQGHEVARLRFVVDQGLGKPSPRRPLERDRATRDQPLPPELSARLAEVEDPNLRAAIAEAARVSLARQSASGLATSGSAMSGSAMSGSAMSGSAMSSSAGLRSKGPGWGVGDPDFGTPQSDRLARRGGFLRHRRIDKGSG